MDLKDLQFPKNLLHQVKPGPGQRRVSLSSFRQLAVGLARQIWAGTTAWAGLLCPLLNPKPLFGTLKMDLGVVVPGLLYLFLFPAWSHRVNLF